MVMLTDAPSPCMRALSPADLDRMDLQALQDLALDCLDYCDMYSRGSAKHTIARRNHRLITAYFQAMDEASIATHEEQENWAEFVAF